MATPAPPSHNRAYRASYRSGWFGLFSGESAESSVRRTIQRLNANGYRVVFLAPDRWSFFRELGNLLVMICTLGFVSHRPGFLVIGELIESPSDDGQGVDEEKEVVVG